MTKYTRVVKHIEASFIRIMEREGVEEVNTRQIQADYNEHSRYGITTPVSYTHLTLPTSG